MRVLPLTRLAHQLSQAGPSAHVVVTDANGRPLGGVQVQVVSPVETKTGVTDSNGSFTALFQTELRSGQLVELTAQEGAYTVRQTTAASDLRLPVFVKIPVCLPGPLLSTPEMIAGGAGIALAAAGFVWKKQPLLLAGEVLAGAAAFAVIFRHSCP